MNTYIYYCQNHKQFYHTNIETDMNVQIKCNYQICNAECRARKIAGLDNEYENFDFSDDRDYVNNTSQMEIISDES